MTKNSSNEILVSGPLCQEVVVYLRERTNKTQVVNWRYLNTMLTIEAGRVAPLVVTGIIDSDGLTPAALFEYLSKCAPMQSYPIYGVTNSYHLELFQGIVKASELVIAGVFSTNELQLLSDALLSVK